MNADKQFTKQDLKETYDQYFEDLRRFLYYKTGDIDLAEDLVQEVFLKIWEKRSKLNIAMVKNLLYKVAKNLAINYFSHQKVVASHQASAMTERTEYKSPQFVMEEKEFERNLNNVIKAMSEDSRDVFLMSRIDKLTYNEIAERLGVSVKTVEKRIGKAIGTVKKELGVTI